MRAGLVLCTGLPFLLWRLENGRRRLDKCNWLAGLGLRPLDGTLQTLASDAGLPPVDPESRVAAKAGSNRREPEPPPCHGCTCCSSYATRITTAYDEIDRLRREIEAADGRRINTVNNWTPRPRTGS